MDIIVAMFFTIAKVFGNFIEALVILCSVGAGLFFIGMAATKYYNWQNARGDFEESRIPDIAEKKLYSPIDLREMDELADRRIFHNTKDI